MDTHQVDTPTSAPTSRRALIASLLAGGAAVAVAPFLASRASAAEATPPMRDAGDNASLNADLEREARMAATYAIAVAALKGDDAAALLLIHDHHVAYAQALKGYLAVEAIKPNKAPLASPTGSFAAIANQLAALEDQTAAMHIDSLATIKGLDAAKLLASIVTVEARHAAALQVVAGAAPLTAAGN